MTNKEAIFKLIEYCRWLERNFERFNAEPFDKAIGALEDQEAREQYKKWEAVEEEEAREYFERTRQTCEDCISREAVKKLKKYRFNYDTNTTIPKSDLFVKVDDIAALLMVTPRTNLAETSQDVLDKIRAEIENHCGLAKENHCRYCSYCNSVMGVREILEIIDKYKAESEENDE